MAASQTPKKPVFHGSLRSDRDPIPHVCFLVDGGQPQASKTQQQPFNMILKQQLIRLLLLFHTQINPNFTWSFEFISKKGGGIRKVQKTNLGLDDKSLQLFEKELNRHQLSIASGHENLNENTHAYTVIDLVDSMRILAVQKRWDSSPAALNQSPFKLRDSTWVNWQGNVKLRNFLIILSPLPSANGKQSLQCLLGNHCPTDDIDELLEIFREDFLEQSLWTNLMKSRVALYWIDPFTLKDNNKTKSIDSSLIDLCTMALLRIFGGASLNRETLLSTEMCLVISDLFHSNTIDLSSSHQLFMPDSPKTKRDVFAEMIEKSLLPSSKIPRMWSGKARLNSQMADLFTNFSSIPSELSFVLTAASLTSHQGEAKKALEGCTINGLKIIPKQLVDPERASFHCICSGSMIELKTFSGFVAQLASNASVLLLEIIFPEGDRIEAILRPNFPTLGAIQILPYPISTVIDWVKLKENMNEFEKEIVHLPSKKEEEIISTWFSKWDHSLSSFLQTGKILPGSSSRLEDLCMGIWTLQKAHLEPTPKKKSMGGLLFNKEADPDPAFELEKFESIEEALDNVMYYYNCILYGKYPITFFHEHLFPSLYTQLSNFGAPNFMEIALKYFIDQLSITIEDIESRHVSRLNSLAFLTNSSAPCSFEVKIRILIQNWFLKKKQKLKEKDLDVTIDLKNLLKTSIKELRKLEAQLQITIWIECMRISNETQYEIPMKTLYTTKGKKTRKKKKVVMKDHIVNSIHVLIDKLLIWTAGFEESSLSEMNNEEGIWNSFVKPVLVDNYQLYFSDLVATIVTKTGGEEETAGADEALLSPFFKKTKRIVKPRVVEKGKVQKALSRKALLEKRIVAEKPISKKRRTECASKKNDPFGEMNDPAIVSMDQFFKPKTPLANRSSQKVNIFIPETPGENTKNSIFDAVSTPSRKPSQTFRPDLFSPIWQ